LFQVEDEEEEVETAQAVSNDMYLMLRAQASSIELLLGGSF